MPITNDPYLPINRLSSHSNTYSPLSCPWFCYVCLLKHTHPPRYLLKSHGLKQSNEFPSMYSLLIFSLALKSHLFIYSKNTTRLRFPLSLCWRWERKKTTTEKLSWSMTQESDPVYSGDFWGGQRVEGWRQSAACRENSIKLSGGKKGGQQDAKNWRGGWDAR